MLYISRASPFISIQFLVLYLHDWVTSFPNKYLLIFHDYIMLILARQYFVVFVMGIYIFLLTFLWIFAMFFLSKCLWIFSLFVYVWSTLSFTSSKFISKFIKNQIIACFYCFLITLVKVYCNFISSILFRMIKISGLRLALKFLLTFLALFLAIFFCKRQKSISFHKCKISRLNWVKGNFSYFTYHLIKSKLNLYLFYLLSLAF